MEECKYHKNDDGNLVDLETGEILSIDQIAKAIENNLIDEYYLTHELLQKLGKDFQLRLIKYQGENYTCATIKKGYTFGKVFRVDVRELMKKGQLSRNARAFIATVEPFIYFPTNSIIIDSGTPTLDDLCELVDLRKTALYDVLKELENKEVLKRIKRNGQVIIYFNPFLYCSGGFIHKDTYDLFSDSRYNPMNKDKKE